MDSTQLNCLALCLTVAALVGCGTASKTNEYVTPQPAGLALPIGDAAPGVSVALPESNELGMQSVVVDQIYMAASGRQCRRLRATDGTPIARVACKGGDGVWTLARDMRPVSSSHSNAASSNFVMSTDGIDQTLVPSSGSVSLINQEVISVDEIESDAGAESIVVGSVVADSIETVSVEDSSAEYGLVEGRSVSDASEPLVITIEASSASVDAGYPVISGDEYAWPADTVSMSTDQVAPTLGAAELEIEKVDAETLEIETVNRTVNVNETLWSFAKRTTGNALNWKTIAELNGITNAKTLTNGTNLRIPAELVSSGD